MLSCNELPVTSDGPQVELDPGGREEVSELVPIVEIPVADSVPSAIDPLLTRVFSEASPWNTPIGENPELDPHNAQLMNTLRDALDENNKVLGVTPNYKNWTATIHFIDSTLVPKISVYYDQGTGSPSGFHDSVDPDGDGIVHNVPLPSWVWPDPMGDGHMIVYDMSTGTIYEYSRFRWGADGRAIVQGLLLLITEAPVNKWPMKEVVGG